MRHLRSTLSFALAVSTTSMHAAAQTPPAPLRTVTATAAAVSSASAFDGVVEAVRQTVVAAQVPGAIVQLDVKVGDRVKAGQQLLRIDARAAEQNAAASDAQTQAARASLELATKDVERQRRLFQKQYISQASLERAESAYQAARAQANALLAQAGASRTQSGYHVVRAPFTGVVAEVPVSLGDMAMPGRPLLTLYDPTALRVTAAVPQSVAMRMPADPAPRIELAGRPAASAWVTPTSVVVLPTVDAATHTVQLRAGLPPDVGAVSPGMFARLWVAQSSEGEAQAGAVAGAGAGAGAGAPSVMVPVEAIVRRAELTALYALDPQGRPVLRQVRLGRTRDGRIEVLSGLMPGENVVVDPQSAARAQRGPR